MGRPSSFTVEIAEVICARLADGESLRKICADEGMPSRCSVRRWLATENHPFRTQYARAREEQADHYAEEIIEIADADPQTIVSCGDEDGAKSELRVDGAAVQYQRLRIDARKWYASKVAPKKYGEKLDLTGDLGVTHQTADDVRGAINGLLARFGVGTTVGGGATQGGGRSSEGGESRQAE